MVLCWISTVYDVRDLLNATVKLRDREKGSPTWIWDSRSGWP